jgi:hypothetical protein
MHHLWIDVEMCPAHGDRRPSWPFRFQQRVSRANSAKSLGLPTLKAAPDATNVGHLSVRPDYFELAKVDLPDVPAHLIELIPREAAILEQKSSRLGGFDAKGFRRPGDPICVWRCARRWGSWARESVRSFRWFRYSALEPTATSSLPASSLRSAVGAARPRSDCWAGGKESGSPPRFRAGFWADDSVFGVVELQSVPGVGELHSIRVWRCARGSGWPKAARQS